MTTVQEDEAGGTGGKGNAQPPPPQHGGSDSRGAGGLGAYADGVLGVLGMEMRQRLRSRGWYIMLGVWFLIIGAVTALTWWSWRTQEDLRLQWNAGADSMGPGSQIFEIVMAFVLLFGLLVAPALSANAINGDRAGGTLAILQVTLLRPGQIMWGKFLASWIAGMAFLVAAIPFVVFAIVQGGLGFVQIVVCLLMLVVEVGIICAIGVGISALANRPLFSIVVTYLMVAVLTVGTLIAFGLGALISSGTVAVNQVYYKGIEMYQNGEIPDQAPEIYPAPPRPDDVTDEGADYFCYGPLEERQAARTERVAWMLAMNPFVVVADAIPYPERNTQTNTSDSTGFFEMISQAARYAQAGPEGTYECANGKITPSYLGQKTPLWPLGLGLQVLIAAGILTFGRRALRTPAGKLPKGTRVA